MLRDAQKVCGIGQDCPPHDLSGMSSLRQVSGIALQRTPGSLHILNPRLRPNAQFAASRRFCVRTIPSPVGALESSPGRKPCGIDPKTSQPRRGVRKCFVPGIDRPTRSGASAPTGLIATEGPIEM